VFPTEEACCAPQDPAGQPLAAIPGAFPDGCGNVTKAAEPCWVVDTYWPSRQCRQSRTLCGAGEGGAAEGGHKWAYQLASDVILQPAVLCVLALHAE
jgi:hypothetical protein